MRLIRPTVRGVGSAMVAAGVTVALATMPGSAGSAPAPRGAVPPPSTSAGGAGVDKPLLPNMVPLRARDISITGRGEGRRLRFETSLASIGRGPMEVRPNGRIPCATHKRGASQVIYRDVDGSGSFKRSVDTAVTLRKAGCMVFHPSHNHWHFESSSFYSLQPVGRKPARASAYRKTSFCLRDSERVPEHLGDFDRPLFYGACSRDRPMGVNIGWADIYQSFLDGQSLNLARSRVPNGRYCLTIRVDPRDRLRESDERDNVSKRAIRIRDTSLSMLPNRICR
jgi:hypothetical protein